MKGVALSCRDRYDQVFCVERVYSIKARRGLRGASVRSRGRSGSEVGRDGEERVRGNRDVRLEDEIADDGVDALVLRRDDVEETGVEGRALGRVGRVLVEELQGARASSARRPRQVAQALSERPAALVDQHQRERGTHTLNLRVGRSREPVGLEPGEELRLGRDVERAEGEDGALVGLVAVDDGDSGVAPGARELLREVGDKVAVGAREEGEGDRAVREDVGQRVCEEERQLELGAVRERERKETHSSPRASSRRRARAGRRPCRSRSSSPTRSRAGQRPTARSRRARQE